MSAVTVTEHFSCCQALAQRYGVSGCDIGLQVAEWPPLRRLHHDLQVRPAQLVMSVRLHGIQAAEDDYRLLNGRRRSDSANRDAMHPLHGYSSTVRAPNARHVLCQPSAAIHADPLGSTLR